jgi:hypothetical protein
MSGTDEQHMQKAREIGLAIAQYAASLTAGDAIDHEKAVAPIASAFSEAYRSGVEAERARIASDIDAVSRTTEPLLPDVREALKKLAFALRKA